MSPRLLTPALTLCLLTLAACAPSNIKPGASVPTAIKTGQSWVITRPMIAAQVLDTCSRTSPASEPGRISGYWAPSRQQIEQLEAQLPALAPQIAAAGDFDRQYVGIEMDGQQLIYLNAFRLPDNSELNPSRTAIRVCDGGSQFWGAVFNPTTGTFSDVQLNGSGKSP